MSRPEGNQEWCDKDEALKASDRVHRQVFLQLAGLLNQAYQGARASDDAYMRTKEPAQQIFIDAMPNDIKDEVRGILR
jgi:hypothetical protein